MPYTTEEGGRLNNFAREPKVYNAEPPNKKQQITYLVLGIGAAALIGGLFFVAFSVSNVG
ncbi:MAG: ssl1498 family light-harvesting-like protein [Richelia sp. RM2_1_2]|nr:ssl1498 family light-harvesting-like protein [Richelia sp. SM1_7_0]NJN08041.1 ssl1498 family light-harvesting-like protein [Richelia sp. RM1_1_1]NJO27798.1 ssl1498 family light-harvesting-like protein [Richelia sp. SL_2_1]NJO58714.1 ssl1498 family light-harvesting-like protein [Richelia sp. RM2_1_2]NJS15905.1 ssl1498 family light-harvesting-like protein [Nostocaceae cyanobacterium CSU_2_110]